MCVGGEGSGRCKSCMDNDDVARDRDTTELVQGLCDHVKRKQTELFFILSFILSF